MVNEGLIMRVGIFRSGQHHIRDKSGLGAGMHIGISAHIDQGLDCVSRFGDRPFQCPVDRSLFLALRGVERLDRVGVIMGQHTKRIGGLAPFLLT